MNELNVLGPQYERASFGCDDDDHQDNRVLWELECESKTESSEGQRPNSDLD